MLRRPRWLALSVLVVVLVVAFVRLGFWQLHRHQARAAASAVVTANYDRPPVPVGELLRPGAPPDPDSTWRPVRATGRYDARQTVLVRNRTHEGRAGVDIVVPLVLPDGSALLVNRGFVPRTRGASSRVDLPPPPAGDVAVVGAVRRAEGSGDTVVTAGAQRSVPRLDVAAVARTLPYPVLAAAVDLREEQPSVAQSPVRPDRPATGLGPHLAYAIQWWVFAAFPIAGWVLLLRRDLLEEAAAAAPAVTPTPARAG
jgi:cytochrome oxidase assembly protein ShyY1